MTINEKGEATVDMRQDHTHELEIVEHKDGTKTYKLGPPIGQFQARVPIYGKLSFTDKTGKLKGQARGINVGDEWTYRSFIQGRTIRHCHVVFRTSTRTCFPKMSSARAFPSK